MMEPLNLSRRSFLKSLTGSGLLMMAPISLAFDESVYSELDALDCGVASGEPQAHSVVLWTRVPRNARGQGPSCEVLWQVATTPEFTRESIVLEKAQVTGTACDWTVKVLADGLQPNQIYWYRFVTAGGWSSVVGRTKTLPDPNAKLTSARFAYLSCQDYSLGYYHVLDRLAREQLDFVIHLGDAIYAEGRELYQQGAIRRDHIGHGAARTLEEYRSKYLLYLSDPTWREVRRLFPIIYVTDDHELWNDFPFGLLGQEQRRLNSLQAHSEYTTNNVSLMNVASEQSLQSYRSFKLGDLATLFALDLRGFRTDLACDRANASWGCADIAKENRTILGSEQKSWFLDSLESAETTWKLSLSSVMMMPLKIAVASWLTRDLIAGILGGEAASYGDLFLSTDSWDGFPVERAEVIEQIYKKRIKGFVSLAGDIHNYYAGRIHLDPFDVSSPVVGHEVVTASVTSNGLTELFGYLSTTLLYPFLCEGNPHFDFLDTYHHGCIVMEMNHQTITAKRLAVDTVKSKQWKPVNLESTRIRRH